MGLQTRPTVWIGALLLGLALLSACGQKDAPTTADSQTTASSTTIEKPKIGYTAPNFSITTTDGTAITLSNLRGKTVLLNFWATWCGPCKSEIPTLVQTYNTNHGAFMIIGVDMQEDKATVEAYMSHYAVNYPVGLDGHGLVAATYGVHSLPTSIFINADGRITQIRLGAVADTDLSDYLINPTRQ